MEGLAGIVAVEKEIHSRIEEERIKACKWLEDGKRKADEDLLRAEEEIKRNYEKRLSDFENEIRLEASKVLNDALAWRHWADNLNEEELKEVLSKFIIRVIPERQDRSDDTKDVKG